MTSLRARLARVCREPILHFVVLAGLIFGLYSVAAPYADRSDRRIHVSIAQIEAMAQRWESTWGRRPTEAELQGLVRDYVREEIYYREGLRLGLDEDDVIVRNRVRQKMEQFSGVNSFVRAPSDADLASYYVAHMDRYRSPAQYTFHQVYLANRDEINATQTLEMLRQGADPTDISAPLPIPTTLRNASAQDVTNMFGAAFWTSLSEQDIETWTGPIVSGYGQHLVFIASKTDAANESFSKVRHLVAADWTRDENRSAKDASYQSLREQYFVEIEKPSQ